MNKLLLVFASLLFAVNLVMAGTDYITVTSPSTATAATYTNQFTANGTLAKVSFLSSTASGFTNCTVAIINDNQTVFSYAFTTNNAPCYPLIQQHGTTGSALTFLSGTTADANTNTWYGPIVLSGKVTVTLTPSAGGASVNSAKLTVLNK